LVETNALPRSYDVKETFACFAKESVMWSVGAMVLCWDVFFLFLLAH